MDRRHLLLSGKKTILAFTIEANWLHCFGYRQFDLTWEVFFTVWITTWPQQDCELTTRRNPTEALRQRLLAAGFNTTFYGDDFVQSLVMRVATVDFGTLIDAVNGIAAESFERYSVPIELLD